VRVTEPITPFAAHKAAARTSDVIHHGAEASSEARLAENCEGEDLFEAASRTVTIELANLDLTLPLSLRRAKATSSGSMTETRRVRARGARTNPEEKEINRGEREEFVGRTID
jgi:hypothetical protein